MRKPRTRIIGAIVVCCLGITGVVALRVVGPEPHFVCHKAIDGALQQWMRETTNDVWYPNLSGSSGKSLTLLTRYLHEEANALRDYRYIPGLKSDDPADLILFYMREPSRRTWHGDAHWFRLDRRWVILNPRMSQPNGGGARGWSECGEAISTSQFRIRLKATLDFLKASGRPEWQSVVNEHATFLSGIKE